MVCERFHAEEAGYQAERSYGNWFYYVHMNQFGGSTEFHPDSECAKVSPGLAFRGDVLARR